MRRSAATLLSNPVLIHDSELSISPEIYRRYSSFYGRIEPPILDIPIGYLTMLKTEQQKFMQLTNDIKTLWTKPSRTSADVIKIISEAESMFEREGDGLSSAFALSLLTRTYTSKLINDNVRLLKFEMDLEYFSSFLNRLQKETANMFGRIPFEANISITNESSKNEVEIKAYFASNDSKVLAYDTGAKLIELYEHRRKTDKLTPHIEKLNPPDSLDILRTVNQRLEDTDDIDSLWIIHDVGIKNYLFEKGDLSDKIDELMLEIHGGDYHMNLEHSDYINVYEDASKLNEKSRLFDTIQKLCHTATPHYFEDRTFYLDIAGFSEVVNAYKKITPSTDLFYIPLNVTFDNSSRPPVSLSIRHCRDSDLGQFFILFKNAYIE